MEKIIVFILGAIIGSFLNVCIYRLPRGRSVVMPPSHCTRCGKDIHWYDNIPLVSFLILGGRCRSCRWPIPFRYFLVEALAALLALALFMMYGAGVKFFAYVVLVFGLIVATFVDFEVQEIPDEVSLGGIFIGITVATVFPEIFDTHIRMDSFLNSLAGIAAGGGSIYIVKLVGNVIFKDKIEKLGIGEAMGDGDVKLLAMVGAFLGWELALFTFFAAPFFGLAAGLLQRTKYGRDVIPYGPYLSLAALIAIFFGDNILRFFFYGL